MRAEPATPVLATVDRGALPWFGIQAEGVHVNGLVHRPGGLHLWIARRAADRLLDPGKLDHLFAGGIPAGLTPEQTLVKEGAEEAGLDLAVVRQARPAGVVAYTMARPEGLRRDRLHCYDLTLPESVQPRPEDGEVTGFELWPLPRVLETVRDTDAFKFNVSLVLIDLFLRGGRPASPRSHCNLGCPGRRSPGTPVVVLLLSKAAHTADSHGAAVAVGQQTATTDCRRQTWRNRYDTTLRERAVDCRSTEPAHHASIALRLVAQFLFAAACTAHAFDLSPDDARILGDPSFLPTAGQVSGGFSYTYSASLYDVSQNYDAFFNGRMTGRGTHSFLHFNTASPTTSAFSSISSSAIRARASPTPATTSFLSTILAQVGFRTRVVSTTKPSSQAESSRSLP